MLNLPKMSQLQGVKALHQKFYLKKLKTKSLALNQKHKAAYIQGKNSFITLARAKASSYGFIAAAGTDSFSEVCRYVLGEGNTFIGQFYAIKPNLSPQDRMSDLSNLMDFGSEAKTIDEELENNLQCLGALNWFSNVINYVVSLGLGSVIGLPLGFIGQVFDKKISAKVGFDWTFFTCAFVLNKLIELPVAQMAGFLSLIVCSMPYLAGSFIGCLVGICQSFNPLNPFTDSKELVLQPQDLIDIKYVLEKAEASSEVYSQNSGDLYTCICYNMANLSFRLCQIKINQQWVTDNKNTKKLYDMLLTPDSSTIPTQNVKYTLLPIMVNNKRQWVVAEGIG